MKKQSAREGGYKGLFENKNVKRWHDNVSRGSQVTADVYLRRLGHLCNELRKTPQELVERALDMKPNKKSGFCIGLDLDLALEKETSSGTGVHGASNHLVHISWFALSCLRALLILVNLYFKWKDKRKRISCHETHTRLLGDEYRISGMHLDESKVGVDRKRALPIQNIGVFWPSNITHHP
jgi:hypothetical protein